MRSVLYLGDRFVAPHEAVVSLLDRGYLLGDGVFATMRGYGGACFRPDAHLAVLARGSSAFGIPLPCGVARIAALADEAARRTGAADAYVRVTLTRGAPGAAPTLSIFARPMTDVPSADDYARGVRAVFVTPRRVPPACMDPTIKSTSYAAQVLARREAEAKGAAEGIQLTIDGALACGTMSNLFVVLGGELLTPSTDSGCRAGITRAVVLELAGRLEMPVREARLAPELLAHAEEAFFTSTRVECLPIATVAGRPIGRAGGAGFERIRALREALVARIHEETAARSSGAARGAAAPPGGEEPTSARSSGAARGAAAPPGGEEPTSVRSEEAAHGDGAEHAAPPSSAEVGR